MSEEGAQCCGTTADFSDMADICPAMPRRLLVSGLLIDWMRMHFGDEDKIESPLLRQATYSSDIADTNIAIDMVSKYRPALSEKRPGVFVKAGPWKVVRHGIDDRKMGNSRAPIQCEFNRTTFYNTFFQGSHTLFCVAGEDAEVEILAAEVYRELMQFGPVVRRLFNFLRFVVSDIGEPALLEESTENFVVPVVVSYGLQDMWAICPPCCQEMNEMRLRAAEAVNFVRRSSAPTT